jgi:hypothetical protein
MTGRPPLMAKSSTRAPPDATHLRELLGASPGTSG